MPRIKQIFEKKEILKYLEDRKLVKQYQKAKYFLISNHQSNVRFKERNPKGCGIWYFRINSQYRALGVLNEKNELIVFEIDNHR